MQAKLAATPRTPFRPYLAQGAQALRAEQQALHALEPPPTLAADFAAYLAKLDEVVAKVDEAVKLADDGAAQRSFEAAGSLAGEARTAASRLGLNDCGTGKPVHVPAGGQTPTTRS